MQLQNEDIIKLLSRYQDGTCTDEEARLIKKWWLTHRSETHMSLHDSEVHNELLTVWNRLVFEHKQSTKPAWRTWGIAAAVVAFFTVAAVAMFFVWKGFPNSEDSSPLETAYHLSRSERFRVDVEPGGQRARLITPEGTLIDLDESASGIRVNSNVTYLDGSVIVDVNKIESAEEYYAMETPKGGTYHMELPDGTQVWLNADSRIYYPLTFTGTKRVVKLIGEAYFEVAHDPNKIFIVETKDEKVKVLGTKFNVKAYPEDAYSCTTLKEGKVEVEVETPMDGIYTQVLLPNQQSIFKNGQLEVKNVNAYTATAWKKNNFRFHEDHISDIMKTLSRWYDIEVVFEGEPTTEKFSGHISRNRNISEVLELLEKTRAVEFRIEKTDESDERRVIVMK